MIANHRYLQASLFSFCIHAVIFLYIYGSFNTDSTQSLLISKPLQIELKFDLPSQKITKINPASTKVDTSLQSQSSQDVIYSKTQDVTKTPQGNALIESNIANLLVEESEINADKEQQEVSMYAQRIISMIEDAWMKPRNIPDSLVANLRLKIRSSGRITDVDLIKSSGNIRFDNSALQAVRRVETFNFLVQFQKPYMRRSFR